MAPRLCANLTMLFTELPMDQRFQAAKDAGFEGVEVLFPYDLPARDLHRAAVRAGVDFVLINCPPPNWTGGPRGFAAVPGLEDRFRRDFERALRVAEALRARHIHIMAGKAEGEDAEGTFIQNLRWACGRAPSQSLLIEPLNRGDMPGYFLSDFDVAARIIAAVARPNLGLQFDVYHAQILTGDAVGTFQKHAPLVRHIQIAGLPGRHEPVTGGGLDMRAFLGAVAASGYGGWISAEYHPAITTEAGLGWLVPARAALSRAAPSRAGAAGR